MTCDLLRIDDWSRRGVRSDRRLSASNNGGHTKCTHTLTVIIPITAITSHFFDADQFCGLLGSFGPSHETGFSSTGSLTGASVSKEPGPKVSRCRSSSVSVASGLSMEGS